MLEAVPNPDWVARPGSFARSHEAGRSVDVTIASLQEQCPPARRVGGVCLVDMGTDLVGLGDKAFEADYGAKWPKVVAKITEHIDVLLAFYDYPAEHWIHLRTTNPIESTFATVRLRQRITKGPARGPPESRWRSSSSSPHEPAGAPSTPSTSWPWSAQAPRSRKASSSNDPTNQEVISKSRDTPIHRS
jgi:hypothetical protein